MGISRWDSVVSISSYQNWHSVNSTKTSFDPNSIKHDSQKPDFHYYGS
ncbi:hypothetical protein SLEP1_g40553 [Rubroshorea leprosula]|uniref:Uncharacterized protein n=1 Tax=Rubroshorea leprosula TaxID=152421 RepID=A0AAV5L3X7_9ROSI|nr:hypothetical protein SLEP1_g40553 [Rubroshorea leprosula]